MRRVLAAAVAALALAAPSSALAQAPFVGARVGYATPFGDVGGTGNGWISTRDIISSEVPIEIDAGFKLGRPVAVGIYFGYAFGRLASTTSMARACGSYDCSASVIRVGAQGALHSEIRPGREVWVGILGGWERLALSAPTELTTSGWEFGLQGGFDFASGTTGFGPFAALNFGKFSDLSRGGTDVTLPEKATHGTFEVGLRGYFQL